MVFSDKWMGEQLRFAWLDQGLWYILVFKEASSLDERESVAAHESVQIRLRRNRDGPLFGAMGNWVMSSMENPASPK